ncbi:hypothetical protein GWG54_12845 [Natronococcus sp. JC468]|uniref:hypothetical protein n=1 Tax=Natronococcus sp. JC468 TaxID=1961921 RepID=UPI00143AB7EA|nr:hypothetical protein [Natronococcus sp. JC468]NKE36688.1 hypothetical protein [Natronococcus sp. JC468]
MERFVGVVVAGGLALVAGLWLLALFETWSALRIAGLALAVLGTGGLSVGIASELEVGLGRDA